MPKKPKGKPLASDQLEEKGQEPAGKPYDFSKVTFPFENLTGRRGGRRGWGMDELKKTKTDSDAEEKGDG